MNGTNTKFMIRYQNQKQIQPVKNLKKIDVESPRKTRSSLKIQQSNLQKKKKKEKENKDSMLLTGCRILMI